MSIFLTDLILSFPIIAFLAAGHFLRRWADRP